MLLWQVEGTGTRLTMENVRAMSFDEAEWWLARIRRENMRVARKISSGGDGDGESSWLDDDELEECDEEDTDTTPTHKLRVSDFNLPDIDAEPADEDD